MILVSHTEMNLFLYLGFASLGVIVEKFYKVEYTHDKTLEILSSKI